VKRSRARQIAYRLAGELIDAEIMAGMLSARVESFQPRATDDDIAKIEEEIVTISQRLLYFGRRAAG
jgi:hypothetical protein